MPKLKHSKFARISSVVVAIIQIIFLPLFITSCKFEPQEEKLIDLLPEKVRGYIDSISIDELADYKPEISVKELNNGMVKVKLIYTIKDSLPQNDWKLNIKPSFKPKFNWSPHLTPTSEHIIAQHVYRAPAIIGSNSEKMIAIMPDISLIAKGSPVPWYMDMDAPNNIITLGASKNKVREHVLFVKDKGAIYPPGSFEYGFNILVSDKAEDIENPWRRILSEYWKTYGKPLYDAGDPVDDDLNPYVERSYNWAFDNWKNAVWQEFELNGKKVGAPVFIVNVTQSPNYEEPYDEREFRSIWNQAWFSSLRSASGLFRYAKKTNNDTLLTYANLGKELALAFPQKSGFFNGLIATEMQQVEIEKKLYNRSMGWDTYYFGNSNRNPITRDAKKSPFHILDMSWTSYLMLKWYEELEKDECLINYATEYADALLKIQGVDNFFPAWLNVDSLEPLKILNQSPETSMSVTFLLELYKITSNTVYRNAALNAMDAVIDDVIPIGKWEDFETYWSCSTYGVDNLGKKFERNNMFKQNNFSMYWTAEALLSCYEITNDRKYIKWGQRVMDELLMTQATWQPPFMYVNTLGGFGVMNADGEWNDSRQSLFAELIIQYGQKLDNQEYIERGMAALKASFIMMYCPENPLTKEQWEKKYPFFGPEDYGFMMENYGHGGETSSKGIGIGEFTIYDWGNGAAAEGYNRIDDHLNLDDYNS
ncbi:hypothetical protein, partial [Maribacter polysiphoniae]|uniref:hypothetical protein n=1 Tax=Maribacter polysiphoniae TaxID=429344 RepID=UPI00235651DA